MTYSCLDQLHRVHRSLLICLGPSAEPSQPGVRRAVPGAADEHAERDRDDRDEYLGQSRQQLAYGAQLRRVKRTTDARVQLAAAVEIFERLGAAPWADRANGELRATGITVSKADAGLASLAPQQRQIALLAAAGHTNKEIAARLFLSPRTVSTHLYQVFPKLGSTSRAALRAALADIPAD
jgi:DNA-binding CsgD family transcriptional regulator